MVLARCEKGLFAPRRLVMDFSALQRSWLVALYQVEPVEFN
jgi:hypothetical protein